MGACSSAGDSCSSSCAHVRCGKLSRCYPANSEIEDNVNVLEGDFLAHSPTPFPRSPHMSGTVHVSEDTDCTSDLASQASGTLEKRSDSGNSTCTDASGGSTVSTESKRSTIRRARVALKLMQTMGMEPSAALQVMIDTPGNVYERYNMGAELGRGGFGIVKKATVISTAATRAIKFLPKGAMKERMSTVRNEIEIMKLVDHPNIVKLYEVLEDDEHIYIVMEICKGGHLLSYVKASGRLSEVTAAICLQQVLYAIYYMHNHNIVHRDIKAENCLLVSRDVQSRSSVRLSDFGVSRIFKQGKMMHDRVGTLTHMAPEMFVKNYTQACDLWSTGVLMYHLLSGDVPWYCADREDMIAAIRNTPPTFGADWVDASQESLSLVSLLLTKNPRARYTVDQALNHAFFKRKAPKENPLQLSPELLMNLRSFRKLNKFKRAALQIVASLLNEEDIAVLRRVFVSLDQDGNGLLAVSELRDKLKKAQVQVTDIDDIFEDHDTLQGGQRDFSYTEFLAATFDRKLCAKEEVCRAAFQSFDKNGDGLISIAELASGRLLGHLSLEDLGQTMADLDRDGNCFIDFGEFQSMMMDGI